ncbi:MAG: type II toxin-antitoxin system RelE/ParE family toxin [Candidatus Nanopelagicales bacterium]|mgnify:FL=1
MGTHRVTYTEAALHQLVAIDDYLATVGVPDTAFVADVVAFCDSLTTFPHRGRDRSDLRPGLRTIGYKHRILIAYQTTADTVTIGGVFYGGQDYEHQLAATDQ